MGNMIAAEFLKLRKRPMTWWMLGIMAVITTITFVVNDQLARHSTNARTARDALRRATLPEGVHTAFAAATGLWGILVVIAIAVVVGNEFQYGTLRTQLAMGLRRTPYLLSKAIAVYLAGLIGLAIIFVFGLALSLLVTVMHGAPVTFAGGFDRAFWQGLGTQLLGTATTFALALVITILARQVVAGVAIVLGYNILEGTITSLLSSLGGGWAKAVNFFLTPNIRALSYNLDRSLKVNSELFPAPVAATLLAAYAIIFLAVSLIIFNRRDVKGAG
jgi:ABC-2 type transport system permease protein